MVEQLAPHEVEALVRSIVSVFAMKDYVTETDPTANQVLQFNETDNHFKPTTITGLGHTEDHDHDGTPTQKLIAANTHESVSASTHHTKYTDAEAVLAVEAETTLEFDAATTIDTATGALTFGSANGLNVGTADDHVSMIGSTSFAFQGNTQIDANGDIAVPTGTRVFVQAAAASDPNDDLNEIGAGVSGQVLFIHPTNGDNITLKHLTAGGGTGKQLALSDDADVTLSEDWHFAIAIYDTTSTQWEVLIPRGFDDATSDPLVDGTAADGTEDSAARKDHVHPNVVAYLSLHNTETSTATAGTFDVFDNSFYTGSISQLAHVTAKNITYTESDSNGRFTCDVAGIYEITIHVIIGNDVTEGTDCRILDGGVAFYSGSLLTNTAADPIDFTASAIRAMSAADFFNVTINALTGNAQAFAGTSITIKKIAEFV